MTCNTLYSIIYVTRNKEVVIISKSRAEYMKQRRKDKKSFNVLIDKERFIELEHKLQKDNKTKKQWLEEKIDKDIKN